MQKFARIKSHNAFSNVRNNVMWRQGDVVDHPRQGWPHMAHIKKAAEVICLVYILIETARDSTRTRVLMVHSSRLPHSLHVLVSSRSTRRYVGKSVPSQRKQKYSECLASLSTIFARECECLHLCVLHLVHISPKVSMSTRDENVNQAIQSLINQNPCCNQKILTAKMNLASRTALRILHDDLGVKAYDCLCSSYFFVFFFAHEMNNLA